MRFLKKIVKIFKTNEEQKNHPKDIHLEQIKSDIALTEIELRDR
jgi:hypothetical protein